MRNPRSRTYAVDASGTIQSPSQTLLILGGSATVRPEISDLFIGFSALAAEINLSVVVQRCTTLGSSTPLTPQPLDPADPAASTIAGGNCTSEPVYVSAQVLLSLGVNRQASYRWRAERQGRLVSPAIAQSGLGLFGVHSSLGPVMYVTAHFTETGSSRIGDNTPGVAIWYTDSDRTANVNYSGRTYVMRRPVAHAWTFLPTNTYWVATDGDDRNAGSSATPFRTIAKALSIALAGDAIYVRAGTYEENIVVVGSGTPAGGWLVLSCAPGALGLVKVKRPAADVALNPSQDVVSLRGAYVWVNGFIVQGTAGVPGAADSTGAPKQRGIAGTATSSNLRVTNCAVHSNTGSGIVAGGPGCWLEGNTVLLNGVDTSDHGIASDQYLLTCYGNISFDNRGDGIRGPAGSDNQDVAGNLCFLNGVAGISQAGTDATVQFNTASGNLFGFRYSDTTLRAYVDHNIWAINTSLGVTGNNAVSQDNLDDYNAIQGGFTPGNFGIHDVFDQDPLFVAPATGNYELQAGSLFLALACYAPPLI